MLLTMVFVRVLYQCGAQVQKWAPPKGAHRQILATLNKMTRDNFGRLYETLLELVHPGVDIIGEL